MGQHVVNEQQDKDPSVDLAGWLSDVGRRTWRPVQGPGKSASDGATVSNEDLVRYLEELAGREFKSREDVRLYVDELTRKDREANQVHRRRRVLKDTVLLLGLLMAFIQYHFLDINLQIARLPSTLVFVPVEAGFSPQRQQPPRVPGGCRPGVAVRRPPPDRRALRAVWVGAHTAEHSSFRFTQ